MMVVTVPAMMVMMMMPAVVVPHVVMMTMSAHMMMVMVVPVAYLHDRVGRACSVRQRRGGGDWAGEADRCEHRESYDRFLHQRFLIYSRWLREKPRHHVNRQGSAGHSGSKATLNAGEQSRWRLRSGAGST